MRLVLLLCLIAGCSTVRYDGPCGTITRTGFASDLSAGRIMIEVGPDCEKRVLVDGGSSIQSEALKAAVQGAVEGAAKALTP